MDIVYEIPGYSLWLLVLIFFAMGALIGAGAHIVWNDISAPPKADEPITRIDIA